MDRWWVLGVEVRIEELVLLELLDEGGVERLARGKFGGCFVGLDVLAECDLVGRGELGLLHLLPSLVLFDEFVFSFCISF